MQETPIPQKWPKRSENDHRYPEVGRKLTETSFWEISGFAGSIVALIGNITGDPGSLDTFRRTA